MNAISRKGPRSFGLGTEIKNFQADFRSVTGTELQHFFCPYLLRDEASQLIEGHIIPGALGGKQKVLQRADIDNGFGSFFEAEAADAIRYGFNGEALSAVFDGDAEKFKKISRRFKPCIHFPGADIPIQAALGRAGDSAMLMIPTRRLMDALAGGISVEPHMARISVMLDARSSITISCLRSTHLLWFHEIGYRYVFSPEGMFLGGMLGKIFERFVARKPDGGSGGGHRKGRSLMSDDVKKVVNAYCFLFQNLVKPLPEDVLQRFPEPIQQGTPASRWFLVLRDGADIYGRITILPLGGQYALVLTPMTADARRDALMSLAAHMNLECSLAMWDPEQDLFSVTEEAISFVWHSAYSAITDIPQQPLTIREASQVMSTAKTVSLG